MKTQKSTKMKNKKNQKEKDIIVCPTPIAIRDIPAKKKNQKEELSEAFEDISEYDIVYAPPNSKMMDEVKRRVRNDQTIEVLEEVYKEYNAIMGNYRRRGSAAYLFRCWLEQKLASLI